MGFKEVGGARTYLKYKDCVKGQVLVEGRYVRSFEGKYGIQYEYIQDDGEVIVLNKAGQLDYKMDFIKPDAIVKITYDGHIILDKGTYKGSKSHQFTVLCDDDFAEEPETADSEGIDDFSDL
jgi:hypothetical protein